METNRVSRQPCRRWAHVACVLTHVAVLDAPLGAALRTTLPKGAGYTTLELKVNLLRAVKPDTGALRAVGRVVHRGRRTAVTEARMKDSAGRLYAYATSTCLILENERKPAGQD